MTLSDVRTITLVARLASQATIIALEMEVGAAPLDQIEQSSLTHSPDLAIPIIKSNRTCQEPAKSAITSPKTQTTDIRTSADNSTSKSKRPRE
jgi:hypothetical protein